MVHTDTADATQGGRGSSNKRNERRRRPLTRTRQGLRLEHPQETMDEEDRHEEEVSAGDVGTLRSVQTCGEARNLFPVRTPSILSYASIIPAFLSAMSDGASNTNVTSTPDL